MPSESGELKLEGRQSQPAKPQAPQPHGDTHRHLWRLDVDNNLDLDIHVTRQILFITSKI